jgi:hypothetical protein
MLALQPIRALPKTRDIELPEGPSGLGFQQKSGVASSGWHKTCLAHSIQMGAS